MTLPIKELRAKAEQFRVMGLRDVPFAAVQPYESAAKRNHDQSLRRLNERGGLDVSELWAVVHNKSLRELRGAVAAGVDFHAWFEVWITDYESNELRVENERLTARIATLAALAGEACNIAHRAVTVSGSGEYARINQIREELK